MKTKRFELNEIQRKDIVNIHKGLSDPRVTAYYAVHFSTLEDTQEQMDWYDDLKNKGTGIWWGIYLADSGEFCGAGGFNGLDREHKKAEIGLWLLPEFWGQGIMKEVMPRLFQEGFEQLGLNRIEGFVESGNSKCKKGLEKFHFEHEGTMRQCEFKNGKFIDVDIFSILKSDYEAARGKVHANEF